MQIPRPPVPQPRCPLQHPRTAPRQAPPQRPKLLPAGFPSPSRPGRAPEGLAAILRPPAP